ncbi:MAG TPA: hypothetical protein VJH68_01625 [Candidatus Nanoarchaeia archaeon]|nr:hypothetical protein [Candidatus Nanoarchaeia archaeon]
MFRSDHSRQQPELEQFIAHLIKFKKRYLLSLAIIILLIPATVNLLMGKPLLMGPEGYYHLQQARELSWGNLHYFPLQIISLLLPLDALFIVPLLLAVISMVLLLKIIKGTSLPEELVFFCLLFLILSPGFIYNYSTLSANSYFLFLSILGIYLFSRKNNAVKLLGLIPLAAASWFNAFFTLLIALIFSFYACFSKKDRLPALSIVILLLLSALLNAILLGQSILPPEFHDQNLITSLISAFGAVGGISLFFLLLALIGLAITWKKKFFSIFYLFFIVVLGGYLFSQELVFFLSIMITFFAAVAFLFLIRQPWQLPLIKKFTLFIIILGILFSTLSYLNRVNLNDPSAAQVETLQWIRENTSADAIILSSTQHVDYIHYFAERRAVQDLYKDKNYVAGQYRALVGALQVDELQQLLDTHGITILYLTPDLKQLLPAGQGSLSLLNTENFKLVHSNQELEVWFYQKRAVSEQASRPDK